MLVSDPCAAEIPNQTFDRQEGHGVQNMTVTENQISSDREDNPN